MGNVNEPPDVEPAAPSGPATGYLSLGSSTAVVKDSAELITILRRLRTDPGYSIRTVQLLDRNYDISSIAAEYYVMAPPNNYLVWPNMICLDNNAVITMTLTFSGDPTERLQLLMLMTDAGTAYLENVRFNVVAISPVSGNIEQQVAILSQDPTITGAISYANLELRRVVGNMHLTLAVPEIVATVEESELENVRIDRLGAFNARNSTIGYFVFDNTTDTTLTHAVLDNCTLTGTVVDPGTAKYEPAISYSSIRGLVVRNCRFTSSRIPLAAVLVIGSGADAQLALQNCSFDWTGGGDLIDLDTLANEVHVWLIGIVDLNPSATVKIIQSDPSATSTIHVGTATNLQSANFSLIDAVLTVDDVGAP